PDIAPIQIVIVPIVSKQEPEIVENKCKEIYEELKKAGFRMHYDDRDLRPGNKYYSWELKGVPLRIELGARDIQNGVITTARRDSGEKSQIPFDNMVDGIKEQLLAVQENLFARAKKQLDESMFELNDLSDAKPGINIMGWCGEEDCGHQIENATEMAVLGVPVEKEPVSGNCIVCGKPTDTTIYVAKTY
ncbi:MAG: proline--tRNA ligase, partial [Thermoplasmata archaeon]|nr:proline--tRNA ligase [Thermoplasmata archaeon]